MPRATLLVRDQVNVKFEGLDPAIRRKLSDELKYMVPNARHMPQYKLGRWDGTVSFCSAGGSTYLNLIDRLLPILCEDGYTIDIDDRRPFYEFNFLEITEDMYAHKVWPKGHERAAEPIILRDYQVEAIQTFTENLQSVQEISTGAGKTIITAVLSALVEPYGRSVVIVPSKNLVTQTEKDYRNLGLDVGVFYGERKEWGHKHTISTWQSLTVFSKKSKKDEVIIPIEEFLRDVICVMVDECFDGNTPILTPTGWKAIQDCRAGDQVINRDDETEQFKIDVVEKLHVNIASKDEKMFELEMDNGTMVHVTGNHRFLTTTRGWVRADELTEQDDLVTKYPDADSRNKKDSHETDKS